MAKLTLPPVPSGYMSTQALNARFEQIEEAIEDTVSRSGKLPNAMEADVDFGMNNLLNIDSFEAQRITMGGSSADLTAIQNIEGIGQAIVDLASIQFGPVALNTLTDLGSVSAELFEIIVQLPNIALVGGDIVNVNTVATNISNVNTVGGISGNVTTVADNAGNVNTVASVSSDVTTVAGQIAPVNNVSTVAGISGNVSTVAGISADVTTAATTVAPSIANVNTVAANIANVNTVAPISANITTVAGISANVTAVAGNNANVTTVATNILDVNTVADNIASGVFVPRTGATASAAIPSGTEAQRDVIPAAGYFRFNTQTTQFEGYNGTAWGSVGGGATGAAGDQVFVENDNIVNTSYEITASRNAMSAGPITVATGVVVTIPSNSRWVIV